MATESKIRGPECCTPLAKEPFVSYSLNFEDVILNRLFAAVPTGFYIDVGAAHPRVANDTFLFYQKGWRGINVEPNHRFYVALAEERPQDINLPVLLSEVPGGKLVYYEVDANGLSTCDAEQAKAYRGSGHNVVERLVPVTTLSIVIQDAEIDRINLLKVDVEGFEEKVLNGNDWERFRPEVVVVEATYPNSPVRRPTKIVEAMEQRGYRRVYFDGLNDFFLERNFPAPEGLTLPPNVFDHFVLREVADLRREHEEAAEYARSLETELEPLRDELQKTLEKADSLAAENRRLGHKIDQLDFENRRLHNSAAQMRGELLALQKFLEPLHAMNDLQNEFAATKARLESLHNSAAQMPAELLALHNSAAQMRGELLALHKLLEPLPAMNDLQNELAATKARLESTFRSRSWKVTAPLRWCDDTMRRIAQKYFGGK
jgi:FkbM family methyltransferase